MVGSADILPTQPCFAGVLPAQDTFVIIRDHVSSTLIHFNINNPSSRMPASDEKHPSSPNRNGVALTDRDGQSDPYSPVCHAH